MSDAESEATVYGYSSDEEQYSYNIEDVRELDDQDFRRVTDLAVSYADENIHLRYGSLSLAGIDGMALAARLRDVASRPA